LGSFLASASTCALEELDDPSACTSDGPLPLLFGTINCAKGFISSANGGGAASSISWESFARASGIGSGIDLIASPIADFIWARLSYWTGFKPSIADIISDSGSWAVDLTGAEVSFFQLVDFSSVEQ
jgi:hypothetical protein